MLEGSSQNTLKGKSGLNGPERFIEPCKINMWTVDKPISLVQNAVIEWVFCCQEELLVDAEGNYCMSSKDLTDAEARRQLNVFIKPTGENISKTVHNWKDIEVIGKLRKFDKDWKAKLL